MSLQSGKIFAATIMSPLLTRKSFLQLTAAAIPGLLLPKAADARQSTNLDRRERVADVFRMFHQLGSHRTATPPDDDTAEWLTREVSRRGAEGMPRTFDLDRVDLRASFVEAGGTRREALPFFDGGFTSSDGIRGRAGAPGSGSPIVIVTLDQAAISSEGRSIATLRRDPAVKVIVALTEGGMPGLCPSNAVDFTRPYGAPV